MFGSFKGKIVLSRKKTNGNPSLSKGKVYNTSFGTMPPFITHIRIMFEVHLVCRV